MSEPNEQTSGDAGAGGSTGDLGAELYRLVAAVQDWARRSVPAPRDDAGPVECVSWCPVCQFAHVLRGGEHPEVAERLADAGTALANAIKALAEATLSRAAGGGPDGAADSAASRPRPAPRVQRIDLDEPGAS